MNQIQLIISYFELSEQERRLRFLARNTSEILQSRLFAIGQAHFAVLDKESGRVTAYGDNSFGQCNVQAWSGITKVAAGDFHTVALKKDGTVLAVGDDACGQCRVGAWSRVVDVFAENAMTVGVCDDGTLLVTHTGDAVGADPEEPQAPDESDVPISEASQQQLIARIKKYKEANVVSVLKQLDRGSAYYIHNLEWLDSDLLETACRLLAERYGEPQ